MTRPFAVFDIDGTIMRWQLYHALADEMGRSGYMDAEHYQKVRQARMVWKQRTNADSFEEYEATLIKGFEHALTNIRSEDLMKACKKVIGEYKDQVYTYTRDLIKELRSKGYLLFAISASQDEIVKLIADYYGFDDAGGSHYETKDGRFTGDNEILKGELKPLFLKKLLAKHGATRKGSIGVGDTQGDIAMLSTVEKPIAFNPTKTLFEHARKQKWKVVIERKNTIYELEPKDGSYILAQTDS